MRDPLSDRPAGEREIDAVVRLLEHGTRDGLFDRFVEGAAAALGVSAATMTILDGDRIKTYGATGTMHYAWPRAQSLSDLVITTADVVVVDDLRTHGDPVAVSRLLAAGIRFYAGAPLRTLAGQTIGAFNVLGFEPRGFAAAERASLRALAELAMLLVRERLERLAIDCEREEFRGIIADAPSAIVSTDRAGSVLWWNAAAERLFGWEFAAVHATPLIGIAPERRAAVTKALGHVIDDGSVLRSVPSVGIASDGQRLDLLMSAVPKRDEFGIAIGANIIIEDASTEIRRIEGAERRSAVLELAAADAPLDRILECLADYVEHALPHSICGVLVRGDDGRLSPYSGSAVPEAIQARIDEIARERPPFLTAFGEPRIVRLDVFTPESPNALYVELQRAGYRMTWHQPIFDSRSGLRGALVAHVPYQRPPTDEESRLLQEATSLAAIAIEGDVARAVLERLALHDALTGLPNRALLERRLEIERRGVHEGRPGFALAMLDIDRFKIINDNLGHAVGDQLLIEIGNRLRTAIRATDFVARLAGDEFLIILNSVTERETATLVMNKILTSLEQQFSPGGNDLFVRASVGIAFYPADALEPAELMRRADLAMYAAKENGSRIGFGDAATAAGESKIALETELNRAVEHDEFELVYQPSIDVRRGRITGAEALLRWRHPRLGTLAPGHFIPLAEQTGLIVPIGEWALVEACRFARRWRDAGGAGVVSVNVSARQFEKSGFVDTVLGAIDRAGIDASQLWLEVTETLIMRSPETTTTTLAALRLRGVRSTIDDFGTGYSSLAYLKRYPIAGLKIDRAFVKDLGSADDVGDGDRAIVATIVALGAALGLSIVAEGAETREQIEILRELGCDDVQGFYFARPMPADALLTWELPDASLDDRDRMHHASAVASSS